MLLAAYPSEFFPSLSFFDKMKRADVFVLIDDAPFSPGGPQHRLTVKTLDGPRWLSAPIVNRSLREPLREKRIDCASEAGFHWTARMLLSLRLAYHEAPYFNLYRSSLAGILNSPWQRLWELNAASIDFCREALGIRTPLLRSSEITHKGIHPIQICQAVGADAYLANDGSEADTFGRAGIELVPDLFRHPHYTQYPRPESFVEGLSVIDLLLNCGPQSNLILDKGHAYEAAAQR